jgi:hypothetical protein
MQSIIDFHVHCGIQHNTVYSVDAVSRFLLASPVQKGVISSLSSEKVLNVLYAHKRDI